jgi:VanZ family protein
MSPGRSLRLLSLWGPLIAGLAVSFYLSSQPGGNVPSVAPDYLAHAVEYGILGMLALRAFQGGMGSPPEPRAFALAILLCVLWGISDELHQLWVPGREASISDLVSDVLGVLLACGLYTWLWRLRVTR